MQPSVTVIWDKEIVILPDFLETGQMINSDHYIMTLTKIKVQISRVRLEKGAAFLLQQDNVRPHSSLKTMEHVAKFGWSALLHSSVHANERRAMQATFSCH
jgi:hypothetical protein